MKKPVYRIVIVDRESIAVLKRKSMSVQVRLTVPLNYLSNEEMISVRSYDERNITDEIINQCDLFSFSRSYSEFTTELMKNIKKLGKKIIYDVDDFMLSVSKWEGFTLTETMINNYVTQSKLADCITVPHEALKEKLNDIDKKIEVIPTCIDTKRFSPLHYENHSGKIVFTNLMDLKLGNAREQFLDAIRKFMENYTDIILYMYGDPFDEMQEIPRLDYKGFVPYDEHKKLLASVSYLFAICPLGGQEEEEAFEHNWYKSNVKYLEYGIAKIPGIYSDTPAYSNIIKNKINGLLVRNTSDEWYKAMELLVTTEELRATIIRNAYDDVITHYDVGIIANKWFELFKYLLM